MGVVRTKPDTEPCCECCTSQETAPGEWRFTSMFPCACHDFPGICRCGRGDIRRTRFVGTAGTIPPQHGLDDRGLEGLVTAHNFSPKRDS